MKGFKPLTLSLGLLVLWTGLLPAQTIDKRVPKGTGQQTSLLPGRDSNPETERRIRESQGLIVTQAEKIRILEARIKELEAELAALKSGAAASSAATPVAKP